MDVGISREDKWTIRYDELLKTCLGLIPLALFRVAIAELVIKEENYLLVLDISILIILVLNLSPYGLEWGLSTELDPATQKSSHAYFTRFTINALVLLYFVVLFFKEVLPEKNGRKILIYVAHLNWIRFVVHSSKYVVTRRLENNRKEAEDGQERMSNETGEMIEKSELLTLVMATVTLSITQLGFNSFGLEGTLFSLAHYIVISVVFFCWPLGFHLSPNSSWEDQNLAIEFRIVANSYSLLSALSAWMTWYLMQNKVESIFRHPNETIRQMAEKALFLKIVDLMMSHFIIFTVLIRLLVLDVKFLLSYIPV